MLEGFHRRSVLVLSALLVVAFSQARADNPQSSADELKAARLLANSICSHCHGADGYSGEPGVPNLAGQQRAYLEIQLAGFRTGKARDPDGQHNMLAIGSAWLTSERVTSDLAMYFASLQPAPPKATEDAAAIAAGKRLYERPRPDPAHPGCAGCHGTNGEGFSVFPRVAGQNMKYLERQLDLFQLGMRGGQSLHSGELSNLSDEELNALAAFMASMGSK